MGDINYTRSEGANEWDGCVQSRQSCHWFEMDWPTKEGIKRIKVCQHWEKNQWSTKVSKRRTEGQKLQDRKHLKSFPIRKSFRCNWFTLSSGKTWSEQNTSGENQTPLSIHGIFRLQDMHRLVERWRKMLWANSGLMRRESWLRSTPEKIQGKAVCDVEKISEQVWWFEWERPHRPRYLVLPCWRKDITGVELWEFITWSTFQVALSASCLGFRMWSLSFLFLPPCLLLAAAPSAITDS